MLSVLICLLISAIGGLAILIADFYTSRHLFYSWQKRITLGEYALAFFGGILIMTFIWLMIRKWDK
jgi:cytochrome b subunit of formate dehydrogenase